MNVKNNYKECITPISYFNITPNILMKINPAENGMPNYYFKDLTKNINKPEKIYKTIDKYI